MAQELQQQFRDMGRIPIRPLAYINKDKAFTSELLIDSVGEDPTYHIFIANPEDSSQFIDLSAIIIQEGFNSKDLTINIPGVKEPVSVFEIMSYIYSRFVHSDNINGFEYDRDISKITDTNNKNILLKDINGGYVFPVTKSDCIYDSNGISLQKRLDNMSRVSFATDYILVGTDNQSVFQITYPFKNYPLGGNWMELRIGTTIIDKSRYQVINNTADDGNIYTCTVTFFDDTFEIGRRIDIFYIYNSLSTSNTEISVLDGGSMANASISIDKLSKYSDKYTLPDSTSLATSKALYNLYTEFLSALSQSSPNAVFVKDLSDSPVQISMSLVNYNIGLSGNYTLVTTYINKIKKSDLTVSVLFKGDNEPIEKKYNVTIPNGLSVGRVVKFLINENECILLDTVDIHLSRDRFVYYATKEDVTTISFAQLDYDNTKELSVYRNGLRLFENIDYRLDSSLRTITLFASLEPKEIVVFETQYITY